MKLTRRRLMILSAAGAIGGASALDADGESGTLFGGKMALSQAFKVADGLWIGPTSARGSVPQESGNVYMSSDEDVDFYYDGTSWVTRSIGSSTTAVPSVTTDELNTGDKEGTSQSIQAALSNGKIVGVANGIGNPIKVLDPTTAASDDAAIQAVNDWIENGSRRPGFIWVPHVDPNGNPLDIESTVTVGDPDNTENARISIGFWPPGETGGQAITTSITDGSHMFLMAGDAGAAGLHNAVRFIGGTFNLGGNNAGLVKWEDSVGFECHPRRVVNFSGDAVTIDGGCFNWTLSGHYDPNDSTGRCIVFANTTTNGPPGDGRIQDETVCLPSSAACIDVDHSSVAPPIFVSGHFEGGDGTDGTATLNLTAGDWVLTSKCKVGGSENSAHGVNFTGRSLVMRAPFIVGNGGDGLRIDDPLEAYVYPFVATSNTGDDVNIVNEPSAANGKLVLPPEVWFTAAGGGGGTVTYPSATWGTTWYWNGMQKLRTFTDQTVAQGGSATPNNFMGRADEEVDIRVFPDSDPDNTPQWRIEQAWNNSSNRNTFVLIETDGGSGPIDLGGVVYRVDQSTNLR